jgi:hypothetical protein
MRGKLLKPRVFVQLMRREKERRVPSGRLVRSGPWRRRKERNRLEKCEVPAGLSREGRQNGVGSKRATESS